MAFYLVTGGAGFIGSHLCAHLDQKGHKVLVVDDLSTGKPDNLPAHIPLIPVCMLTSGLMDHLIQQVDGVFHMAAIASVQKCNELWSATHTTNVTATLCAFEAARTHKKPVVYASSAAVYGTPAYLPLDEKAPLEPLSNYGLDKKACEDYARVGASLFPLQTVGLRFFNVYGERQDPKSPYSGVISLFMGALQDKQPLTILGTGEQTRDFVYVADVARALMGCMDRLHGMPDDQGIAEVYNVATGHQCSVASLAESLIQIAEGQASIQYKAPRLGDIQHSLGKPDALRQAISWTAEVPLQEGLTRLWNSLQTP